MKTLEAPSASPPFNDREDGTDLNSLASIAPGNTVAKPTVTPDAQTTGTAGELSLKFGASEEFQNTSFLNRLQGPFLWQHLPSPQSVSSSQHSKSCATLGQPNLGYSPATPIASALHKEPISDSRCSTARPATCVASCFRNVCLNNDGNQQNGASSSCWGVIEEQQERLEHLQQAICYCEERSNMGRALRSREAAVRARLLHEQLEQQLHIQKTRKERNDALINEAVGFSLRKAIIQHRPAAERLGSCLSVLHKHMQRSLSSSAFAIASTTPGIGGTQLSVSAALAQKDHEELQFKNKPITPLHFTLGTLGSVKQETSRGHEASITNEYSKASTSVLYEGAADALAARELLQTRAALLLQEDHDTNTSDSLQRLLCLEGEVRGQMAFLGAGDRRGRLHSEATGGERVNAVENCSGSPPIPEETSGLHERKILPQSPPQRLIADSQLHCSNNSAHINKGLLHQTTAHAPLKKGTDSDSQPAFGEQQWINLARQVSVLQEMLLRNQRQYQKLHRKRRSDREHACSRESACSSESMQTAGAMGMKATNSSSNAPSGPLDKVAERPSSSATEANGYAISRGESRSDTALSSCTKMKDKSDSVRRSAAEERLRRHLLRVQQQNEQNDAGGCEARRQRASKSGCHDGPVETSNFPPMPDVQTRDCASTANGVNGLYNNGGSNLSCGTNAVHKVRSCSGTPPASAVPPSRGDLNGTDTGRTSAAVPTKTSQVIHRLPPMAKVAPSMLPSGAERPINPSGKLRPFPPPGTPTLPSISLAVSSAATYQTTLKAELSDKECSITGTKHELTDAAPNSATQIQPISTKEPDLGANSHLTPIGTLPPPEEVANLLLGIK